MKAFLVHNPGPLSTVQDAGRPGLRRYGIPPSGAMDQFSCQVANLLVGNAPHVPAIEITLAGFTIEALAPMLVAITGADLGMRVNDRPAALWASMSLRPGDIIQFTSAVMGSRSYLAMRGGVSAAEFLGSRSTFVKGNMGRPLNAREVIHTGAPTAKAPAQHRSLAPELRPAFSGAPAIHVIPGPQAEYFTARGMTTFIESVYRLSPQSDRQGLRTDGPAIEIAKGPDIISDPTPLGAIQVPADGKPIILHRDGQVTGGYAKIGVVASADLDKLGRLAPGDPMRFEMITPSDAAVLRARSRAQLNILTAALIAQ